MRKKYFIELAILIGLIIVEIVVVGVMYSEALNADNIDLYMSSILVVFINIDVLYGIVVYLLNSIWKNKE